MRFPKLSKKQWIIGSSVISVLIIILIVIFSGGDKTKEFVTETVRRGFLEQTVEVTGSLESVDHVDLSFNTSGNLGSLYVNIGDTVEEGELLAELDADDLKADVRRAEQSFNIASANLNLKIQGASNESIAVRSASVDIAKAALETAEADLVRVKLSTALALNKANDDYDNTVAQNSLTITEVNEDYINAMKSAMIGIRYSLSEADEVLGIENTIVNDAFQSILSNQDSEALTSANRAFETAQDSRDDAENIVFELTVESSEDDINLASSKIETALHDVQMTLLYTRQALDATTLETADFSLSDLASLKTSIDTARDALQIDEQNFYTYKQLYISSVQTVNTNLDNVKNALAQAEIDAVSSVAISEATVAMRKADLQSANALLAEFVAEPRDIDLVTLQSAVKSAQADLDAANARLAKTQIYSAINGQITDIALEIGEQVSAASAFISVQSSDDLFEVTLDVPEVDIIKISLDDEAQVEFDAYGDDKQASGKVVSINPAQKDLEGVVYYEVTVMLDDVSEDLSLKSGMSTDVIIVTDQRQSALYVRQRAVLENENNEKFVRIPRGSKYDEVIVETGLRADGGLVEIKNGLAEGEMIIITILEK